MVTILNKVLPKIYPKIYYSRCSIVTCESAINTVLGSKTGVLISSAGKSNLVESQIAYPSVNGAISISSGTGHYRVNGGAWVNTPGTLIDTDYFEARVESSYEYSTNVELVFSIDGTPDTFTVTTMVDGPYILDVWGIPILDVWGVPLTYIYEYVTVAGVIVTVNGEPTWVRM